MSNVTDFNKIRHKSTNKELDNKQVFYDLFKDSPVPSELILDNLGLYTSRQAMSRIIFMHHIYSKIIDVPGAVMEFGVRWGQNLALFSTFRGMYEPFNYYRKIIGFDTFAGFPSVSKADGDSDLIKVGSCNVSENYEDYLEKVLMCHEGFSPVSHIKKFELIKGDATVTLEKYLNKHPETIVSLAYFDFVLYEPTKRCLNLLKNHLTKGSIIGFDELNHPDCPGETIAVQEELGLLNYRFERISTTPGLSYLIVD